MPTEPARARVRPADLAAGPGAPRPALALGVILVAGLVLRLAPASWMSYFGDEVQSLAIARHGVGAALASAAHDVHPPLFLVLLSLWLRIAPALPEWGVRLLPIAIGLLWVLATYRLAALSLSPRASLVAAAVIGIHPMAVLFTEPVRWYGLLALALTMALVHLERALRWSRRPDFAWLAFWNVVAGWTSILGWIFAAGSLLLWSLRRRWTREPTPWPDVIGSYGVALVALLPVVSAIAPRIAARTQTFDSTGLRVGLFFKPAYLAFALTAGQTSLPWDVPTLIALGLFFAGLLTALWRGWRDIRLGASLAIWLPVLVISTMVVTNVSSPHYYLALLAGVALLVGWVSQRAGLAPRVALIGFAAAGLIGIWHLERGRQFQREEFVDPWREIVAGLRNHAGRHDVVFFSHPSIGLYAERDERFRYTLAPARLIDALGPPDPPNGGGPDARVFAVVSPLSGALPEFAAVGHWLAESLAVRGYVLASDSGLVRSDAPEARRRFSGRPFPTWRVRLLEWRSIRDNVSGGH